jgi:cytochrome bd-type quinol oxidase subunit 2
MPVSSASRRASIGWKICIPAAALLAVCGGIAQERDLLLAALICWCGAAALAGLGGYLLALSREPRVRKVVHWKRPSAWLIPASLVLAVLWTVLGHAGRNTSDAGSWLWLVGLLWWVTACLNAFGLGVDYGGASDAPGRARLATP